MNSEEVISKNRQPSVEDCRFLAAELGFEPRQTESESAVLPLHNSATNKAYYTHIKYDCQGFFETFFAFLKFFINNSRPEILYQIGKIFTSERRDNPLKSSPPKQHPQCPCAFCR